ncbi:hypothetical protein FACS18945_2780 [Bacteroidia bacterium]|nr:hypothetical protein FACS18945_2780 [Bacteroidia bacterium]
MNVAALTLGAVLGYYLSHRKKDLGDPKILTSVMMLAIGFMMAMQPEFFRFGQLGHLTVLHLIGLIELAIFSISALILLYFAPKGWGDKSVYKKLQILLLIFSGFALVLFGLTESPLALGLVSVIWGLITFIAVRHASKADAEKTHKLGHSVWFLTIAAFGIVTEIPVLVCAAILLWGAADVKRADFKPLI